jgi:hypothetical protein
MIAFPLGLALGLMLGVLVGFVVTLLAMIPGSAFEDMGSAFEDMGHLDPENPGNACRPLRLVSRSIRQGRANS